MPKLEVAGGSLLLRACLRAGDLDFALDVLRAHRQLRSALSKSVCLDLLAALSKEGRTDEMLDAFSYMRAAQPGVACPKALSIIGAGLGRKGLAAQATQVLLQVLCLAAVFARKYCFRSLVSQLSLLGLDLLSCHRTLACTCKPKRFLPAQEFPEVPLPCLPRQSGCRV